ncbi:19347_t:CDS:1, partial [Rhizophagus irregularis]
ASANSDEAEIWLQLAELRRNRAFTTNKTFEELAYLMVQIKELEIARKRKTEI